MGQRTKLPLVISGIIIVLYSMAVLGFVATSPDLQLRCLIFEQPAIPALEPEQGVPIYPTPDMLCQGELPRPGDVLLKIGESRTRTFLDFTHQLSELRNAPIPPGGQLHTNADPSELSDSLPSIVEYPDGQRWVKIEFERLNQDGTTERHTGSFLQVQSLPLSQVTLTFVWFVLQLGILAFAALSFWNRPFDRSSRLFFGMCIVSLGAFVGGFHWWVIAASLWLNIPFVVCAVLVPAVLLHFFLVFPRPKQPLLESPFWTLSGIYLLPGGVIVWFLWLLVNASRLQFREVSDVNVESIRQALQSLYGGIYWYLAVATIYFVLMLIALWQSYRTARNPLERRQLIWILGAGLVALPFIGYTLFLALFQEVKFALGAARIPMLLASLSFMLAYTVGILRYRFMLVDQVLSKGMMYYVLTSGLTVAFSLAVGLGMLLPHFLNISPSPQQALTVVAVLVLGVMLLLWLRDRFQQGIDRQYFREKYQLDKALQRMNLAVNHPAEPEALAEMMLGSCRDVLEVEQAALYLRATPNGPFQLVAAEGAEDVPLQFHPDDEFLEALKQSGSLQRVTPGIRSEMSTIQNSLRELKADLVCALEGDAALDGMVTLGKKINSSPYSAEDLTFLNALGQITYVAFRSAKVDRDIVRLNEELQEKIEKISNQQRQIIVLQSELSATQNEYEPKHLRSEKGGDEFRHDSIKGNSPAMQKFLEMVRKVAKSESSVVIRGESGTGKELLAQLLHNNSPRHSKPLVRVHCAALSSNLLESELFGHVKGAFTGAYRDKIGRFEMADGGTLFLDEIGDISLETQVKLLRVLQERCFEQVGGTRTIHVDVRLITATHQDLEKLIAARQFREDLFYRLNVISLRVPPLRERKEDILELAISFLNRSAGRLKKRFTHFDDEALSALEQYNWPGNVRELENAIERAAVLSDDEVITLHDLPEEIIQPVGTGLGRFVQERDVSGNRVPPRRGSLPGVLNSVGYETSSGERIALSNSEREVLEDALLQSGGNKAQAARLLGVPRSTYYSKLKKYGIS